MVSVVLSLCSWEGVGFCCGVEGHACVCLFISLLCRGAEWRGVELADIMERSAARKDPLCCVVEPRKGVGECLEEYFEVVDEQFDDWGCFRCEHAVNADPDGAVAERLESLLVDGRVSRTMSIRVEACFGIRSSRRRHICSRDNGVDQILKSVREDTGHGMGIAAFVLETLAASNGFWIVVVGSMTVRQLQWLD